MLAIGRFNGAWVRGSAPVRPVGQSGSSNSLSTDLGRVSVILPPDR